MIEYGNGLAEIVRDRGESPVLVARSEAGLLWRFPDGTEVVETNGDPVVEGERGWEELRRMFE